MPATFQAPLGASALLLCPFASIRGQPKVHAKLRQNADSIANVILLVILHKQLTTLTR